MKKRFRYINTKWQSLFLGIFLILTLFSSASIANKTDFEENLHLSYTFENPIIQKVEIEGSSFDKITMQSCIPAGEVGEPLIPSKGVYILLPPKSKVNDIQIKPNNKQKP